MLRGSVPILVAPNLFQNNPGYDGTTYAAAKLAAYYRNSIYALGDEMGVLVIDLVDVIGNYPQTTVYFDGIHPSTAGHEIIGRRLCAPLIGRGYKQPEIIVGERQLGADVLTDNIEGRSGAEILASVNSNSFGKAVFSSTDAADMVVAVGAGSEMYWSFYLAEDAKHVMPIGYLSAGCTVTYSIDFDNTSSAGQPVKLRADPLGVRPGQVSRPSHKVITSATEKDLNHQSVVADHVVITGKGWHTLRIATTGAAFVTSGVRFWDEKIYWKALTLLNGMTQFRDSVPAWGINDEGVILFRGVLVSPTPTSRLRMFDIPAAVLAYIPPNLPTTSKALTWTTVPVSIETGGLYWEPSGATNTFNLANIYMPAGYLPTP